MISGRAAAVAVIVAFLAGLVGSLAIRPVHPPVDSVTDDGKSSNEPVRTRWRVPGFLSRNLPVVGPMADRLRDFVYEGSGGRFDIQVLEPGEVVPVFAITEAVGEGKVQAGFTFAGYDQGRIPASVLISAVPFGLDPIGYAGWWFGAGGEALGAELYRPHNIQPLLCGLTGPETAGWFREPLEGSEDLQGLKIRFAGLGGRIIEQLGASVTMLPGGEIFQALEKGAIDATEFSLPIVDQALGFHRVARYNYFPGWHQPFTASYLMVNLDAWNGLTEADQSLLQTSCKALALELLATSEAAQGAVIGQFEERGARALTLPPDLLDALRNASEDVLEEQAAADPMFERILRSQQAYSRHYRIWKALGYLPVEQP